MAETCLFKVFGLRPLFRPSCRYDNRELTVGVEDGIFFILHQRTKALYEYS